MPGVESTEEMARSLGIDEGLMHRIEACHLVGLKEDTTCQVSLMIDPVE